MRIVEAPDLAAARAELEPLTGMHVHSVMPNQPGDVAFVANEDYLQVRIQHRVSCAVGGVCSSSNIVMPNQPGDVAFVANEDYLHVCCV